MTFDTPSGVEGVISRWDVIGHQNIGMDATPMRLAGFPQQFKIKAVILCRVETGLTVAAALGDVLGNIRKIDADGSRHNDFSKGGCHYACWLIQKSISSVSRSGPDKAENVSGPLLLFSLGSIYLWQQSDPLQRLTFYVLESPVRVQ